MSPASSTAFPDMKPLILHAHAGAGPVPYKVGIVLEALNLPYHVKLWEAKPGLSTNPRNGTRGARYLAINPNGRVPALEDPNFSSPDNAGPDGQLIAWESGAVINHLLRHYDPEHRLHPSLAAGDSAQALVDFDKWLFFMVSTLGPFMGQVSWFRNYNAKPNEDALERYEQQTFNNFGLLEEQIRATGSGWVLKRGFTAADAHFYAWVSIHERCFKRDLIDRWPNVKEWLERVAGLECVKRAYENLPKGEKQ